MGTLRTTYHPLFGITILHGFYRDGVSRNVRLEPTPATTGLLRRFGLVFRPNDRGGTVYGELDPTNPAPRLLRPLESEAAVFTFLLQPIDPAFLTITALPAYTGHPIFYFNNRFDGVDGETRFLGDSVASQPVGAPIRFVDRDTYTYAFAPARQHGTVTISDITGAVRHTVSFSEPAPIEVLTIDLAGIPDFPASLYTAGDDQGGEERFYYAPSLFGKSCFGIVDIFTRDLPAEYAFIDAAGALNSAKGAYAIGFDARETTWRYIVESKYANNGIVLTDLSIQSTPAGITFTAVVETDRVVFDSDAPIALGETGPMLHLMKNGTRYSDLPIASADAPLQAGVGSYRSDMYIYI